MATKSVEIQATFATTSKGCYKRQTTAKINRKKSDVLNTFGAGLHAEEAVHAHERIDADETVLGLWSDAVGARRFAPATDDDGVLACADACNAPIGTRGAALRRRIRSFAAIKCDRDKTGEGDGT